ncbi:MAG: c-type cytochrome biogenesis protein CcmI [Alphaproteobacteria bacterium]|nr:c-type cytochrome biogenesis protein CcmI [Alphaproteobacteria bacterium]
MLWLVFTAMTGLALVLLLTPLLRKARPDAVAEAGGHDLAVYRDQLRELEAEAERGTIAAGEFEAARTEIERRLLAAAEHQPQEKQPQAAGRQADLVAALCLALALPAAAAGLYLWLGAPDQPGVPLAGRPASPPPAAQAVPDMTAAVAGLRKRLEQNPDNRQGWLMLGRSYGVLKRYAEAARAYGRAADIEDGADVRMALGEALAHAAEGSVTPAAEAAFRQALAFDPRHIGGRFYLGIMEAQRGRWRAAFDLWLEIAADTPADASWRQALMQHLEDAAGRLDLDLAALLPEPPAGSDAAAELRGTTPQQQQQIRAMVARLAARLENSPDDLEGWLKLARSYRELGDKPKTLSALAQAGRLAPLDAEVQMMHAAEIIQQAGPQSAVPAAAVSLMQRVLGLDAKNRDALYFIGLWQAQAGHKAEAIATWQRLLALLEPGGRAHQSVKQRIEALEAQPKKANGGAGG